MRRVSLVAVAAVATGAVAAAVSGAAVSGAAPHGAAVSGAAVARLPALVADVPSGSHRTARAAEASNLPYNGGPVLHANRTHVIFWQPAGSGLTFDPGYIGMIETFLRRVAADSHRPTNVYGLTGQYHDYAGPAAYASTFGRTVLDTDRLPSNGCTEPPTAPLGWQLHCVNGAQMEAEIEHVVHADHLPDTQRDIFFLLTPNRFGSCIDSNPADGCALGGQSAPNSYCGYHNVSADGTILYAVIPYNAVAGHCQSNNPRPNNSTADPTLSTLSHEHNEIITDPLGTAWIDSSYNEDGDLCLTDYGPERGDAGTSKAWNEVIHGGHYYIQEEWSNNDSSCQQRDESDRISFRVSGATVKGGRVSFVASASDPDGTITAYHWFFGSGAGQVHGRIAQHVFNRAGAYRVVLMSTDYADNYAFATRTVTIRRR